MRTLQVFEEWEPTQPMLTHNSHSTRRKQRIAVDDITDI